jgi:hypothetical protein
MKNIYKGGQNYSYLNQYLYLSNQSDSYRSCSGDINAGQRFKMLNHIFSASANKGPDVGIIDIEINYLTIDSYHYTANIIININLFDGKSHIFSKNNIDSRNGILLDSTTDNTQLLLLYNKLQNNWYDFSFIVFDKNINNPTLDSLNLNDMMILLGNKINTHNKTANFTTNPNDIQIDIILNIIKQRLGSLIPFNSLNSINICPSTIIPELGIFSKPWKVDSNILYVALPIDRLSQIGAEIDRRIRIINANAQVPAGNPNNKIFSPFFNPKQRFDPSNIAVSGIPHITLLTLYIPIDSDYDKYLTSNLQKFSNEIHSSFMSILNISNLNQPIQLHSNGTYGKLGKFIAKNFDDITYINRFKGLYDNFIKNIVYKLLDKIRPFQVNDFDTKIRIEENIKPYEKKTQDSPEEFIHYSFYPKFYPNSEIAISSFQKTNWKPHISLLKTTAVNEADPIYIAQRNSIEAQNTIGQNIDFFNMCSYNTQKLVNGINQRGSISEIQVEYGRNTYPVKIPI